MGRSPGAIPVPESGETSCGAEFPARLPGLGGCAGVQRVRRPVEGYIRCMNDLRDHRLAPSDGGGLGDLHREAQASLALILITLAVVLTISFVGFALS